MLDLLPSFYSSSFRKAFALLLHSTNKIKLLRILLKFWQSTSGLFYFLKKPIKWDIVFFYGHRFQVPVNQKQFHGKKIMVLHVILRHNSKKPDCSINSEKILINKYALQITIINSFQRQKEAYRWQPYAKQIKLTLTNLTN